MQDRNYAGIEWSKLEKILLEFLNRRRVHAGVETCRQAFGEVVGPEVFWRNLLRGFDPQRDNVHQAAAREGRDGKLSSAVGEYAGVCHGTLFDREDELVVGLPAFLDFYLVVGVGCLDLFSDQINLVSFNIVAVEHGDQLVAVHVEFL